MREPISYDRPGRFWDGGLHHCFGYRVTYLPAGYTLINSWGRPYYFLDDIYYRFYDGIYHVCRPPFGVFFDVAADFAYAACRIAYYSDVYRTYNTIDENYATIEEQNRTIARNNALIAQQNSQIELNNERAVSSYTLSNGLGLVQSFADAATEYFYEDGVFFVKNSDGRYVTIVPPAGALVQKLPEDYEEITMNGTLYYRVDDTVYRHTIVDGTAYFEVLGQLAAETAKKYGITL